MTDMDYDVVVVGAGPAGSFTAKHIALNCADKGIKVRILMIEKRQEIGSPVRCGEGISKLWLDEVGIKPNPRWIAHEVDGVNIISPNGSTVTIDEKMAGNETGYVVHRDIFDRELAKDAARAGVDIMIKTSAIELLTEQLKNGETKVVGIKAKHMGEIFNINSKIVVAADGFESQVGRWAGIDTSLKPSDTNSCFQYTLVGVDYDSHYNAFYIGGEAPGGYIWVFPKGEDIVNVGIGLQLSKMLKEEPGAPKRYLDKFIENHPELSKGKPIREVAGAISCCMPIDQTVGNGILLVGDAARQIDPMTGGGVANACMASKIAGKVIADALEASDFSKEFLTAYDKGWRAKFENGLIRDWIAKEKIATLTDDVFDKVIDSLKEVDIDRLTTMSLLQAVQSKYPELVDELSDLL